MLAPRPAEPFDAWAFGLHHPAFGFVWYARPATLVTQSRRPVADLAAMKVIVSAVSDIVETERDEVMAAGGLRIVHDWRSFGSYESEARRYLLEEIRKRPKEYLRGTLVTLSPTPLWKMAFAAANLVFAFVSVRAPLLFDDPQQMLGRTGSLEPVPRRWSFAS